MNELFGTNAAAHLPIKKEESASGIVNFSVPGSNGGLDPTEAGKAKGWYLKFTFRYDGKIADYYLSNGPQSSLPNFW